MLTQLTLAIVSFRRIRKYLSSEELDESVERDERSDNSSDERYAVCLKKCCFSWGLEEEPILKDITLNVKKGSLVAIVGRVGSGKSSLFSALMGDMYQTGGSRSAMRGSVSYVPQSAWIQNMSLRQNIVFVSDYDRGKYERVVKACALDTDFNSLPAKDLTEIGEKGINLSGGQKHRVSLARAVYHGSDIYLLDDPLAAVDAHVGQHLFQRVIGPKGLLRNTTRILATHHMEFLREADHILVLSEGRVVESGGYDELAERGVLSDHEFNESDNKSKGSGDQMSRQTSRVSESESTAQLCRQISMREESKKGLKEKMKKEADNCQLIDEEIQQFGSIKLSVYWDYLKRIGFWFTLIPLFCSFLFNSCEVGANYWLNIWSSQNSTQTSETSNRTLFLGVYLSAIILDTIFIMVLEIVIRIGALNAAEVLHKDMLYCILRTPLSFFDVTPLGRIINRFNRDIQQVDELIPWYMTEATNYFVYFLIIVAIIVYTNAYMAILVVIVAILFAILYVSFEILLIMIFIDIFVAFLENLFVDFETIKSLKFHHSVTDL